MRHESRQAERYGPQSAEGGHRQSTPDRMETGTIRLDDEE
jgi:hypothetical protein